MAADYTTRPLSDRTWLRPSGQRVRSSFSANWSTTLDLLIGEVFKLQTRGMPDPVIEVDVGERDIRVDGGLRADARTASPAVRIAFDSIHGPMIYQSDRYFAGPEYRNAMQPWQHNVRAIALTLEALRAVDRYGASGHGEQYRGYRQLESGTVKLTPEQAWNVLRIHAGAEPGSADWVSGPALLKLARIQTHPDRNNGQRGPWDDVERAAKALDLI
jgi:hypothetical protein